MCEPGDVIVDKDGREYYYVLSGYGTELRVAYGCSWIQVVNISTLEDTFVKSTVAPKELIAFINDKPSKTLTEGMIVRTRRGYRFKVRSSLDEYDLDLSDIAVVMKVGDPMITIGISFKYSSIVFKEIEVNKDLLVEYTEEEVKLDEMKKQKQKQMEDCCSIL